MPTETASTERIRSAGNYSRLESDEIHSCPMQMSRLSEIFSVHYRVWFWWRCERRLVLRQGRLLRRRTRRPRLDGGPRATLGRCPRHDRYCVQVSIFHLRSDVQDGCSSMHQPGPRRRTSRGPNVFQGPTAVPGSRAHDSLPPGPLRLPAASLRSARTAVGLPLSLIHI